MSDGITLEKAIEIISQKIIFEYSASQTDEGDAIKVSLQAMQRIYRQRRLTIPVYQPRLPGEDMGV